MTVLIVCLVLFAVCTVLETILLGRVRRVLRDRHDEVWRTISAGNWIVEANALQRFVWTGRAAQIGDPELQRLIGHVQTTIAAAIAVWVTLLGVILTGHVFTPK